MSGPLSGVRVLEIGGIGPGPFAGMLLADMGAEVIRVDRPGASLPLPLPPEHDLANRGKHTVALDLKSPAAMGALLELVKRADILIEGFRPGVAERLGFGPDVCHAANAQLVYGRMTGWGQDGPWAQNAGHDVNYLAATGALHAIGPAETPVIPLNLLGDYGGGSTYLVMGVLAALVEARTSGQGQVVDAAIVDGVSHLLSGVHALSNAGVWADERAVNLIDGGAPNYRIYETSDGRHLAVGGIEPQFYAEMLRLMELPVPELSPYERDNWEELHQLLEKEFGSRTLKDWAEVFDGTDACVAPIASLHEAADNPQLKARSSIVNVDGIVQGAPAPRFSRTTTAIGTPPRVNGANTTEVLTSVGLDVAALIAAGAAWQA